MSKEHDEVYQDFACHQHQKDAPKTSDGVVQYVKDMLVDEPRLNAWLDAETSKRYPFITKESRDANSPEYSEVMETMWYGLRHELFCTVIATVLSQMSPLPKD